MNRIKPLSPPVADNDNDEDMREFASYLRQSGFPGGYSVQPVAYGITAGAMAGLVTMAVIAKAADAVRINTRSHAFAAIDAALAIAVGAAVGYRFAYRPLANFVRSFQGGAAPR